MTYDAEKVSALLKASGLSAIISLSDVTPDRLIGFKVQIRIDKSNSIHKELADWIVASIASIQFQTGTTSGDYKTFHLRLAGAIDWEGSPVTYLKYDRALGWSVCIDARTQGRRREWNSAEVSVIAPAVIADPENVEHI